MLRNYFLISIFAASFFSITHADQVIIQSDIVILDECPDYTQWNTRALITERKKLKTDIFLCYAGQIPCVLLSMLAASGAVLCTAKAITKEWHPAALFGSLACASACPAFAALFLSLENKKILARYNSDEISDLLATHEETLCIK